VGEEKGGRAVSIIAKNYYFSPLEFLANQLGTRPPVAHLSPDKDSDWRLLLLLERKDRRSAMICFASGDSSLDEAGEGVGLGPGCRSDLVRMGVKGSAFIGKVRELDAGTVSKRLSFSLAFRLRCEVTVPALLW